MRNGISEMQLFMSNVNLTCFSFKVLFIADAKISFDSFRNGMVATVTSKTIITINPGEILEPQNKIWAD